MARGMNKRVRPFRLEDSDAIEENERILEAGSQKRKENKETEQAEQANNASIESTTSDATTAPTNSTTSTIPTASTDPAASPAPTSASATQEPAHTDTPTNRFDLQQGKKTANGIVVNVPMDDYVQLTMMKFQTGRTLKDLALQAIHEFVARNINS